MSLTQLKLEIEVQLAQLSKIMEEIQRLDKFITESEDGDIASLMVQVILEMGEKFDQKTMEVRIALEYYIDECRNINAPVDFSYVKLLNQITAKVKG